MEGLMGGLMEVSPAVRQGAHLEVLLEASLEVR
jgi:hypothetical protein